MLTDTLPLWLICLILPLVPTPLPIAEPYAEPAAVKVDQRNCSGFIGRICDEQEAENNCRRQRLDR